VQRRQVHSAVRFTPLDFAKPSSWGWRWCTFVFSVHSNGAQGCAVEMQCLLQGSMSGFSAGLRRHLRTKRLGRFNGLHKNVGFEMLLYTRFTVGMLQTPRISAVVVRLGQLCSSKKFLFASLKRCTEFAVTTRWHRKKATKPVKQT
jgi:hypothetical protein